MASPSLPSPSPLPPESPIIAFIYSIGADNNLVWHRHDGAGDGLATWKTAAPVGIGWSGLDHVFGGGDDVIYAITAAGKLNWYKHAGFLNGLGLTSVGSWATNTGNEVGHGWGGQTHVFSTGGGVIYSIAEDGKLMWHRHNKWLTGEGLATPGAWDGPTEVGHGWSGQEHVFSTGSGVIYSIAADGKLIWRRHNKWLTGEGLATPGAWTSSREVGHGWGAQTHVFSSGDGVIYSIAADGKLMWHRHQDWNIGNGLSTPGAWHGTKEVGQGWGGQEHVFALLRG